jgi:hypothetical protein
MNPYQDLISNIATLLTDLSPSGGPEEFDAIPDIPGDILTDLRRNLQEADMGLRVMLDEVAPADDSPDGTYIQVALVIGIVANETVTAASHPYDAGRALTIAWFAQQILHGHSPAGGWTPLEFRSLNLVDRAKTVAYELSFTTTTILSPEPEPLESTPQ